MPCSVPKSKGPVRLVKPLRRLNVLNRMHESVIRVSRFVKDVCVGESRVAVECGDGRRRRNVGNVGAADQQTLTLYLYHAWNHKAKELY